VNEGDQQFVMVSSEALARSLISIHTELEKINKRISRVENKLDTSLSTLEAAFTVLVRDSIT